MTRAEALAEARKRWSSRAFADTLGGKCNVGYGVRAKAYDPAGTLRPIVKGSGDSWEAAFADADRRAKCLT